MRLTEVRSAIINVAGPAALLVAKLHKIGERVGSPDRLNDKDAHDAYRLLVATDTDGQCQAVEATLALSSASNFSRGV